MLVGHGADSYSYDDIKLDFSSNVYPTKTNEELINFLKDKLDIISDYPEAAANSFSKKLENFHNLQKKSVIVTNGAVEAFYLIANAYFGATSLIYTPSFSEYEDACKANMHKIVFSDFNDLLIENIDSKLIWLANPNNPDGRIIECKLILNFLENNPDKILVLDEAYMDFIDNDESVLNYINDFKNLIIVKSFTKSFVLPGLRLGYICADNILIDKLLKFKMPWSVNSIAIEAGKWILENFDKVSPDFLRLIQNSKNLQHEINKINGLDVIFSDCHYFLVKSEKFSASDLKQILADKHKILIRDASNFRGLNEYYFRIASRSYEENSILINVLRQIYE
ncbi:MAG: aminotransferase class I/II-fold pyridoxal phosphate-dependent enzyme [Chlorobi bacterium]|nr:aminotransferase class I/II-fold pyridoxal phosphate-dependent enzyme [Chlorobiota bacterium]